MGKKIADFEILDHGIDHSQYFQGCGTSFTEFTDVATGIGYSQREAFNDALEQLASMGYNIPGELEEEAARCSEVDEVSEAFKDHNPNSYKVYFVTYSGMTIPHDDFETMVDAQEYAKELLDRLQAKGCEVACIEENENNDPIQWEVETESNREGMAVSDNDGCLIIEVDEPELPEDNECYYHVSIRVKTAE